MTEVSGEDWFTDTSAFLLDERLRLLALPFWERVVAHAQPEQALQQISDQLAQLLPDDLISYNRRTVERDGFLLRAAKYDLDDQQRMWVVTLQPINTLWHPLTVYCGGPGTSPSLR